MGGHVERKCIQGFGEGKRPFGISKRKWEDIKMDLQEAG